MLAGVDIFVFFFSESVSFPGEEDVPLFLTVPLWAPVGVAALTAPVEAEAVTVEGALGAPALALAVDEALAVPL